MLTRVAVVEDQREIREALRALLSETPGYCCSGAYRTMEEALPAMELEQPAVALVDVGLPGMSGIQGIAEMRHRMPGITAIVLSVFEDDDRIFDAICAGARGYLLKRTPPVRLLEGIEEALAGGAPLSPEVSRRVLDLFNRFRPPDAAEQQLLTPHELRVLRMLVEGHNYTTAAAELRVSVNTIAFHVRKIYVKLDVHTKSEAVSKALRQGLVK